MRPSEFLALVKDNVPGKGTNREYRAAVEGPKEAYLTLYTSDGRYQSIPYGQIVFLDGDSKGFTEIRLILSVCGMSWLISVRQLQSVVEGIRSQKITHLYEFDGAEWDPPAPGQPVILAIMFDPASLPSEGA